VVPAASSKVPDRDEIIRASLLTFERFRIDVELYCRLASSSFGLYCFLYLLDIAEAGSFEMFKLNSFSKLASEHTLNH
jgi:hypothetical protein